jgi:hypothetical protein
MSASIFQHVDVLDRHCVLKCLPSCLVVCFLYYSRWQAEGGRVTLDGTRLKEQNEPHLDSRYAYNSSFVGW